MSRKLVQNEIAFEKSDSSSIDSLNHLLRLLDDSPTKSIEPKNIFFNYKSYYDRLRKILSFCDHARELIGSGWSDISSRPWKGFKFWSGSCSFMDEDVDLSVYSPVEIRKKTFTRRQNKEELKREVTKHEEKVREYLERLHSREEGSALIIPNFIPPKMKEIVTELVMVENEITRLESQIKQLQHNKDGINVHKNTYNEWGHHRSLKDHLDASPLPPNPHMSRRSNENVVATRGDYHLTEFDANKKLI